MFHELFSFESISMIDGRGTAIVILIAIPDLNETRFCFNCARDRSQGNGNRISTDDVLHVMMGHRGFTLSFLISSNLN